MKDSKRERKRATKSEREKQAYIPSLSLSIAKCVWVARHSTQQTSEPQNMECRPEIDLTLLQSLRWTPATYRSCEEAASTATNTTTTTITNTSPPLSSLA